MALWPLLNLSQSLWVSGRGGLVFRLLISLTPHFCSHTKYPYFQAYGRTGWSSPCPCHGSFPPDGLRPAVTAQKRPEAPTEGAAVATFRGLLFIIIIIFTIQASVRCFMAITITKKGIAVNDCGSMRALSSRPFPPETTMENKRGYSGSSSSQDRPAGDRSDSCSLLY